MKLSDRHRFQLVRFLADVGSQPKIRAHGESMLPLITSGMQLAVAPFRRDRVRLGDILVFRHNARLVFHRVVRIRRDSIETSGDNSPEMVERVRFEDVIGIVAAVYASEAPDAPRIDDAKFRRRGRAFARAHRRRGTARRFKRFGTRCAAAVPWRRKRLFDALCTTLAGRLAANPAAVRGALAEVGIAALAAYAREHECLPLLVEALSLLPPEPATVRLAEDFQVRARATAVGRVPATQLQTLVATLRTADVPFTLLESTANAYTSAAAADRFASNRIDLLVPRAARSRAIALLCNGGYCLAASQGDEDRRSPEDRRSTRLEPIDGKGASIEVHVQIAPPGSLSTPTDWDALERHLVHSNGPAGPVCVLDGSATALQHAIRGYHLHSLREVAACASILSSLDSAGKTELQQIAAAERLEPVRLAAFLTLAAGVAGIAWPRPSRDVEAFLHWVEKREDMPRALGRRAQWLDVWCAGGRPSRPVARLRNLTVSLLAFGYAALLRSRSCRFGRR